ncbi:MAG: hypothetical protein C5S49_04945 [Candidatus Methanogaster sp.]|nr:MAG: hypothetical protein C5S49_04945 [ANME-2 cluster archaeon]
MCNYHKCPHENILGSEFCIFHLRDDNKDINVFNNKIIKIIETNEGSINFSGFYFPPGTTDILEKCFNKNVYFTDAEFSGEVFFHNSEFLGFAHFGRSKFLKDVYFDDSKFLEGSNADFMWAEFFGKTSFERTKFLGITQFVGTKFFGETSFKNAEFVGDADFNGAEFLDSEPEGLGMVGVSEVNFRGAKFFGEADFHGTVFSVGVTFAGAKFLGLTKFWMAKFSKDTVSFYNAEFEGDAYFSDVNFLGAAIFSSAKISSIFFGDTEFLNVDFWDTEFLGWASFAKAKFLEEANFCNAVFRGGTCFDGAEFCGFSEKVNFENAEFLGDVSFEKTKFLRFASFRKAKFENACFFEAIITSSNFSDCAFMDIRFIKTKFYGGARFERAKFAGNTRFQKIEFFDSVDFSSAVFDGIADFHISDYTIIYFNDTHFSDDVRIKANLSQCYFYGSNIERVDLIDSIWAVGKKNGITIFEEDQKDNYISWKDIEGIYRRLKQSYQRYGDHSTAGELYYREMECKRKQLGFFQKQCWNIFYRRLCGYGEKPFGLVFYTLLIIFGFAIIYFYNGITVCTNDLPTNIIQYNSCSCYPAIDLIFKDERRWKKEGGFY